MPPGLPNGIQRGRKGMTPLEELYDKSLPQGLSRKVFH